MAETVVEAGEAVEVELEDRGRLRGSLGARKRLPDPIQEQGAVGQAGQQVPECGLAELLAECLALPDVAGGQDDLADGRIGEQVRRHGLHLAPDAVAAPQPPFVRLDGPARSGVRDEALESYGVVRVGEPAERPAERGGQIEAEDPLE